MQIATQVIPSEPANPDADSRLREFAYQMAKTHVVEISHSKKTDLLETLQIWELALRNANAVFKSVPAKDASVSRAGEWMLDNFTSSNRPCAKLKRICQPVSQRVTKIGGACCEGTRVFLRSHANGLNTLKARLT